MDRKVIVIGAGHWGKNLVKTFYQLGALAGVAEANPELRERIQGEYPDVQLFHDYKDCLSTSVPAVVIATPAQTHYQIAIDALRADKDVFIEKPMTLSVGEAEKIIALAEQKNKIVMVGHLLLYQPAIQKLKELIDSGEIGELRSLHQERLKLGRVRAVENVLWSFGVHDIAVLLFLAGETAHEIQVHGQRIVQPSIEDDVYLHLQFKHGVSAHLHTSWLWPELRRRLTVIGTKGMIVYDEEQQTLTLHRKSINGDLTNLDNGSEVVFSGAELPLTLECDHFLQCIQTRHKPISDGNNGLAVVRVLEQADFMMERVQN